MSKFGLSRQIWIVAVMILVTKPVSSATLTQLGFYDNDYKFRWSVQWNWVRDFATIFANRSSEGPEGIPGTQWSGPAASLTQEGGRWFMSFTSQHLTHPDGHLDTDPGQVFNPKWDVDNVFSQPLEQGRVNQNSSCKPIHFGNPDHFDCYRLNYNILLNQSGSPTGIFINFDFTGRHVEAVSEPPSIVTLLAPLALLGLIYGCGSRSRQRLEV